MKLIALAASLFVWVGSVAGYSRPESFEVNVYGFDISRPSQYHEYAFQKGAGEDGAFSYSGPTYTTFNGPLGCWKDELSNSAGCRDIKKAVYRPSTGQCQKGMRVGYDSRLATWESTNVYQNTYAPGSLEDYGLVQRDNWGWEEQGTVYRKLGYQHKEWDQAYDEATATWYNVEPPRVYDVFFYYRESDNALVFTEKRTSATESTVKYFEGGLKEAGLQKATESYYDYLPRDACDFAYLKNPEIEQGGAEDKTIEVYSNAILEKYGSKQRGELVLDQSQLQAYLEEVGGQKVNAAAVMREVDANKDKLVNKVELEDYIDSLNLV